MKYKFTQNTENVILSSLGSFWSHLFSDTDTLLSYLKAVSDVGDQNYLDMEDSNQAVSLEDIPVFRSKLWTYLPFSDSDIIHEEYYRFSESKPMGSILVGQQKQINERFKLALPPNIKDVNAVLDNATDPNYVYLKNIDFVIEDGYIVFYFDPTSRFNFYNEEYRMWLFNSNEDKKYVQRCFGEFIRYNTENSDEYYKEVVKGLWRCLAFGTTNLSLRQVISNTFGIPSIFSDGEVVENTVETDRLKQVITNKAVYEYEPNVKITVNKGDVLSQGDVPIDAIQVYMNKNSLPEADIYGFVIEKELVQFSGIKNNLIFLNKDVSVTVEEINGKLRPRFSVTYFKKDDDAYWDAVYTNAEASGINVAGLFRKDQDYSKEVNFESEIVDKLNPLKFLTKNILAVNMFLVVINSSVAKKTLSRRDLSWFRRFIPINTFVAFTISKDADETVENNVNITNIGCLAAEGTESIASPSVSADAFYVSH